MTVQIQPHIPPPTPFLKFVSGAVRGLKFILLAAVLVALPWYVGGLIADDVARRPPHVAPTGRCMESVQVFRPEHYEPATCQAGAVATSGEISIDGKDLPIIVCRCPNATVRL